MMTDEQAIALANTLAQYARDSIAEGLTVDEVARMTVRELVIDIADSTPRALEHLIEPLARELGGF